MLKPPSPQDLEKTSGGWTADLDHLTLLKEALTWSISAEDLSVLQERIELLHRQWEETCLQVRVCVGLATVSTEHQPLPVFGSVPLREKLSFLCGWELHRKQRRL